ncbi:MAG: hypothetical protein QOJ16_1033 [Acidobacteriota bacterium]|jgi:hypothetical protein|nr:hypothetical protein [Acidobacteriota bacterium]
MRGFTAVFRREVAERRLLFFLGLAGCVPLFLPLVVPSYLRADELRAVSAYLLSGIVAGVLALGLGGSVLARDLAERRLGFYFARPLSGWAIWAGKLAAALALSLGVGALVLLPALLFEAGARSDLADFGAGRVLLTLALLAALVLLANVVSTLVRTRSPWLALDLTAAGVLWLLGSYAAEGLLRAGMATVAVTFNSRLDLPLRALLAASPVALTAFLAGSAAQVLGGRTDPRRGHRLLSLILWGVLLAGALGLVGYSRWLLAATPADLVALGRVLPAPTGSAVAVQGPAAHRGGYWPTFLVEPKSGRFSRLFPASQWNGQETVHFSADGRWAAWLEPQDLSRTGPTVLFRLDLTRPGARPLPTRLTFAAPPSLLALSPDGRRLAALEHGRLTVEEIGSARLLAAVPVEPAYPWESRLLFEDGGHVLYFRTGTVGWRLRSPGIDIIELDVATGRTEVIGQTPPVEDSSSPEVSPDGSRFFVHQPQAKLQLFRTRGAVLEAELRSSAQSSGFLADGRIFTLEAAGETGAAGRQLTLLSPDGSVLRRFPFPGAHALRVGGEPSPGHLVLGIATHTVPSVSDGLEHWESRLLDLTTGESRSLGRGLLPMGAPSAGPGSAGSRLFQRSGGRLVRLDLATGRERRVAGRPG